MTDQEQGPGENSDFDPSSIRRPSPLLWRYYVLTALLTVAGAPFVMLALYFKYHSLRYSFDSKGVSMSWGILFRREISLTYRRIQDIHLSRNILQRWLGLATINLQTASASAGAEMSIEGIPQYEALRDFLYRQMRGAAQEKPADTSDDALLLLTEIRDELRGLRAERGLGESPTAVEMTLAETARMQSQPDGAKG
ncbi:MAG: PH domain-containing protein [Myxococcota bacterium]|jgi:putative membrane protein|nr:PH domain-containing protein [Myxococcota bacterium]